MLCPTLQKTGLKFSFDTAFDKVQKCCIIQPMCKARQLAQRTERQKNYRQVGRLQRRNGTPYSHSTVLAHLNHPAGEKSKKYDIFGIIFLQVYWFRRPSTT